MKASSFYAITAAQLLAMAALLWFLFKQRGPWDVQRCLGTALLLIGITGVALARYQLGRSFALKAEAHQLVTHGLYSKIRNPIYVFGAILVSGFVLIFHRPALWLLVAAIIVMQVVRARREAQVLEAAFGDAYRDYRRKTWF